jgi:hypothetical protein
VADCARMNRRPFAVRISCMVSTLTSGREHHFVNHEELFTRS